MIYGFPTKSERAMTDQEITQDSDLERIKRIEYEGEPGGISIFSTKSQNPRQGGDNEMTDYEPNPVEELEELSSEVPEEYGDSFERTLGRLARAAVDDAYSKEDLNDAIIDFTDQYEEVLGNVDDLEGERDFAYSAFETVAEVATEYLNENARALDRMTATLDSAYGPDDLNVDLYGIGGEEHEEALEDFRDTMDEAMDRLSDI